MTRACPVDRVTLGSPARCPGLGRGDLTDAEWEQLRPFLPVSNRRCGRWRDHRQVIDGILHRIRTGAHWRDLPERFGPWKTVYERHRLWSADGTWEYLLQQSRPPPTRTVRSTGTSRWTPLPCAPISTPPAPVSRRPHQFQRDAGSELTGEAARLSLCDRLAEVVQAPKGSAAHAAVHRQDPPERGRTLPTALAAHH